MELKEADQCTKENTPDPVIPVIMVCEEEALSEAQLSTIRKQDEEFKRVTLLLDKLHQTHNVVEKGKSVYGLVPKELANTPVASMPVKSILPNTVPLVPDTSRIAQQYPQNQAPLPMPPLILQNAPTTVRPVVPTPNTYQLLMDRRVSFIVGAVSSPQAITGTSIIQGTTTMAKSQHLATGNIPGPIVMQTPAIVVNTEQGVTTPMVQRVKVPTTGNTLTVLNSSTGSQMPVISSGTRPSSTVHMLQMSGLPNKLPFTQVVSSPYAAPRASIPPNVGSMPASSPLPASSITVPENNRPIPFSTQNSSEDSRAQPFDSSSLKNNVKLYPSLMVSVKPTLQSKEFTTSVCTKMRSELDKDLKKVLLLPPNELTEWLIQQGLIRAEQKCNTHLDSNYQPVPFKLGIYSDSSKFPNSGGYVWVSDCCSQRHLSVFAGSIFEGVPHTPKTILKLVYHWACQTSPTNITQWVHVNLSYIKTFHSAMRAICIASVHEKLKGLGGEKKEVEVAIMTLGTSSNDGKLKQVKVEILGVLDQEKNIIRLCAVEPTKKAPGAPSKRDYHQILRPLVSWVDKKSVIVTDLSIDQNCLHDLGFSNVKQTTTRGDFVLRIVEYLSTSIPRSFQNVLPMINRTLIQQYLDEISWRETFGPSALQAFKNFVIHLSEITKLELDQTLMVCLNRISSDPFQNWEYKNMCKNPSNTVVLANNGQVVNMIPMLPNEENEAPISMIDRLPQSIRQVDPPPRRGRKRAAGSDASESPAPQNILQPVNAKKPRAQTVLQEFYYGRIKGRPKEDLDREEAEWRSNPANNSSVEFQCCVCRRMFNNNLVFMRHLMKHTQNKGSLDPADDTPVCKYCLKTFVTSYILETHVKDVHIVKKGQLACRICNIEFYSNVKLIEHMHSTHVELELPYSCKVCGYRSSMHRDVVDHFHEFHEGSRKLQCPFCLQVVTLSGRGKLAMHNVFLFFQHIQKHFIQPPSLKCEKCILRFATKGNVSEHVLRDHLSCRGKPGLTRLQFKGESIIMPIPEAQSQPSTSPTIANKTISVETPPAQPSRLLQISTGVNGKLKTRNRASLLNHVDLTPLMGMLQEEVKVKKVVTSVPLRCCECKGDIHQEKHFLTNLVCSYCRYITCCSNAIKAHLAEFHSNEENSGTWKPSTDIKVETANKLPVPMYCICGFRSTSGDALAIHLVQSECRTAYASLEGTRALENQSASFPPLVTLDDPIDQDPSDQMMKAYAERMAQSSVSSLSPGNTHSTKSNGEPQSMLNILGLVRKPSTDESSNDIPDTDDKGEFTEKAKNRNRSLLKAHRKKARR